MNKGLAMNIEIVRTYSGIIAECGTSCASLPGVQEVSADTVQRLNDIVTALKRLVDVPSAYSQCWEQFCKYLKLVDSHGVDVSQAFLGAATAFTSPTFGARGYTLFRGDRLRSGHEALVMLNKETQEIFKSLAPHFRKTLWSRLFGR